MSKTVIGLPTAFMYANVAPFDAMRATPRWSLGLRFVLIFAAAVALSVIWRSGKRTIAAVLTVLAMVEVAPAPNLQIHINRAYAAMVANVRRQLLPEFDRLTHRGDQVIMAPSANDFLAIMLGPFAHVQTYNVGGDKNHAASYASWPPVVRAAAAGIYQSAAAGDRIDAVLHGYADVFVISYADLHDGALGWPTLNPRVAQLHSIATQLADDPRFVVTSGTWMASVRLRG